MRLRWECTLFVGPVPMFDDPDECGTVFDVEADAEDVADKSASATCPKCGGTLTMQDDCPSVVLGEG